MGNDNCVSFNRMSPQLPVDAMHHHYVRAEVRVHRTVDDTLALFHGPCKLAAYEATGRLVIVGQEMLKTA